MDYNEYLPSKKATSECESFAKLVVSWRARHVQLFPADVLNMMIDCSMITKEECLELIESGKSKSAVDISLPTRYIGD